MGKPLVLLIEDDPGLNAAFCDILYLDTDVEIEPILDGRVALQRLKGEPPALVLLDLHLPHVSGLEILSEIRADACWNPVPVIVMSADVLRIRNAEPLADFVLIKPVEFEVLTAMVTRYTQPKA